MAGNFVQDGDTLELTAPVGGVVSGEAYLIGAVVVVALTSAAAGAKFSAARTKVFAFRKVAAQAPTEGQKAYFVTATRDVTTVAAGNTLIGFFTQAAAGADATANVCLTGQIV